MLVAGKALASLPDVAESSFGLLTVVTKVAEAGQHMGAELPVVAGRRQAEGSLEVLLCGVIASGVMGHPSSHLGKRCGGGEQIVVGGLGGDAEQAWGDCSLEVIDHGGVELRAAYLPIGQAERLNRSEVV